MNKVILIGRLARDPEMRTTSSGVSVTRFTVAVTRQFTGQGTQPQTDFISCIAWRRQAENIAKYCTVIQMLVVTTTFFIVYIVSITIVAPVLLKVIFADIVADNVTFLGSRNAGDTSSSYGQSNASYQDEMPSYNEPQGMPSNDVSTDPFKDFGEEVALSDDDLPF